MKQTDLLSRYRNLLIVLAREHGEQVYRAQKLRDYAAQEPPNSRHFGGLLAKARAIGHEAHNTKYIVSRNNAALRHFFGTDNLEEVAKREIEYE
jgi:hypothetical protein